MGTYDDLAAEIGYGPLEDGFGEAIQYLPAGGGPARSLTALLAHAGEAQRKAERLDGHELIRVSLRRSADPTVGLDQPRPGDRLLRYGESREYHWTGRVLESSPVGWTLEFSRRTPQRVGLGQTERR